ncbi:trimethylamine--corrinoid protein Co-methyltransferase [Defluviimonas denitrificans]|jgi:trimethylamine--corrinoid protein Co-methyltransferase|uniref:Methyltransferase n=1 Tax=Albidovulum denitrificans TaxID=404881 RepID=A0A2S8S411_9RHOB|nr:trimethylamine methyltransferase family protein [Defluviimonas denitrificans]PQV55525.1 trimethylamine--corrinoid protein Co-methyltransferase [Defluviimonas denitrificans]
MSEEALNCEPRRAARAGGREARRALRAAPLAENLRPIRAGLPGGQYKPLTQEGMARIHEAALDALEVIGLSQAPASGVEIMTRAGAIQGDDGRLRFPRALVEDMLALAARDLTLFGRDPKHDLHLTGTNVHFGTAGAAVHIVDLETNTYRDSTAQDLYDAARITHALDNVHFFQRAMVARDVADNLEMDLNTLYACCSGTTKHVGTSFSDPSHVAPCFEMIHRLAGGEGKWRERPFISNSNCFVVPPMKFAEESCVTMEACIRGGMPVLLLSAGQAGATAPAPIALAIVQAVAECLAGVVYVNAMAPGHPAIFGTWPFVSDLRTGAMSGGSAEQALLTAGCAQMHRFYNLPGGAAAGISDAKLPDMQAGWEQAITNTLAGLSGLNMVYEAVGMHASLLGFCLESLVLGDDILGQVLRCIRGIDVTEDSTSIEAMKSVCLGGPGHYLGSEQTLKLMQTEYVYPALGNRMSPKEWVEADRPMLLDKAIARKNDILSKAGMQVDPQLDAAIRADYNIYFR